MKHLIYTLLFVLIGANSFGQILKDANLNLNSGGVIYDVAYDSYYDAYIVVGDFTSINNQLRTNLAFIDANSFAVMPQAPITTINGEIRSVEFYSYFYMHPALGPAQRSYIYLGGSFTLINGNSRNYLARFQATHIYNQPPAGGLADYNFNAGWDTGINSAGPAYISGVNDLLLHSDTLIVAGHFDIYAPNSGLTASTYHILSLQADQNTSITTGAFPVSPSENFVNFNDLVIMSVEKFDNKYYLSGTENLGNSDGFLYAHYLDGTHDNTVSFNFNVIEGDVTKAKVSTSPNDTTLVTSYQYQQAGTHSLYYFDLPTTSDIGSISHDEFEVYNSRVLSLEYNTNRLDVLERATSGINFFSTPTTYFTLNNISLNSTGLSVPNANQYNELNIAQNKLFLSTQSLTSVEGQSRSGLAVFCLEPIDAEPFNIFDTTICEGETAFYSIPQAQGASGYRWSYTGTGALYRVTGSGASFQPLATQILTGNTNSIEVEFPVGATGGTLSVEPFDTCNISTDYLFSASQSVSITVNPLPDLTIPQTASLNCYSDTVLIVAQSTNPNVEFVWSYNGVLDTTNTVMIYQSQPTVIYQGEYIMKLEDLVTGCISIDTTDFLVDTLAAQISQYSTMPSPSEWTCITSSMTLTSNQLNYIVTWEDQANLGVFHADPYTIDSLPSGLLNIHGIEISNGCPTSAAYGGIIVNQEYADGFMQSYATLDSLIDDTINCFLPTLNLNCEVSPAFSGLASTVWVASGTQSLNLTTADSLGMDNAQTNSYVFETTHNTSGCVNTQEFTVRFDLAQPYVNSMADETLNCSQTSIQMNHLLSGSTIVEGWLDGNGTQTMSNSTTVSSLGEYYYQAQGTNGCLNSDTVLVTQSQELWLDLPTDTLVCPDQTVTLTALAINNTEPLTYNWSTGSTAPTQSATGGIDTMLFVTVTTPSGCIGTDTTAISITDSILAQIDAIAGCTDGNLQVTSVSGGSGNYLYALDGSTWQTATVFSGLSFGSYTVSIQDDLGCVYSFDQTLNGTAISIDMNFLASTYNEQGDTILVSNVTVFTGLDSVGWIYPQAAIVHFENDSILQLSMDDEGWYDITIVGYLDSICQYTLTKPVYFGEQAPLFDTAYVENGIQNFGVSPNPTTGTFNVSVEFGKAQNYSILVTNAMGQPMPSMSISGQGILANHQLSFPIGTATGTYYIHLIADYDARSVAIQLN